MYRHWKSKEEILQEGPEPIPRCDQCGMHMPADKLFKNRRTEICNKVTKRQIRWRDVDMEERCADMEFSLYRGYGYVMVEGVATFKYLGRHLDQTDQDWSEIIRIVLRERTV